MKLNESAGGAAEDYQVATRSLARIRGSFFLLRLLKVTTPVSNPLGVVHALSEPHLDLLGTEPRRRARRRSAAPREGGLHILDAGGSTENLA